MVGINTLKGGTEMAIKVYTDKSLIDQTKYEEGNSVYFDYKYKIKDMTELDKEIMGKIDKATYIGKGGIETPYGITNIYDLSSGTKTVLNIVNNPDRIFDATDCGENALEVLFELIDGTDIKIILRHSMFDVGGREIIANDTETLRTSAGYQVMLYDEYDREGNEE